MKKLLRYADCFVLLAAIVGCLLHLWFQNSGVDSRGMYITSHPAWLLLCLLSAGIVVLTWLLSRHAGTNKEYADNFPRSIVGAATYIIMAAILGYQGINDLLDAQTLLPRVAALAAMCTAVCFGVAGVERFSGYRPPFFVHMVPCVYLMLRIFQMGSEFGTASDICSFLFRFLASLASIPAFYWLWSFHTSQANRRSSLFWSLTAAYFCMITAFEDSNNWYFYLAFAAMLLSNLCRLTALQPVEEVVEETTEEAIEAFAAEPFEEIEEEIIEETPEEPIEESKEEIIEETPEEPVQEPEEESVEDPPAEPEIPAFTPASLSTIPKRAVLHDDIDPETDMDAFLEDIKLFLSTDL